MYHLVYELISCFFNLQFQKMSMLPPQIRLEFLGWVGRCMIKLNWNFLRDRDLPFHGGGMVNVSHFGITDILFFNLCCAIIFVF